MSAANNYNGFTGAGYSFQGTKFYVTNMAPLFPAISNKRTSVSGYYIDAISNISYSLNPERSSFYIAGYATNVTVGLDTNHLVIVNSSKKANNGTNTWNPTIGAYTNNAGKVVVLALDTGFWEWDMGDAPASTLGANENADSYAAIAIGGGLQSDADLTNDLQNVTWEDYNGGGNPKTWFPTNSFTTNLVALYRSQLNSRLPTVVTSVGTRTNAFTLLDLPVGAWGDWNSNGITSTNSFYRSVNSNGTILNYHLQFQP
jgi:hypothetical protein